MSELNTVCISTKEYRDLLLESFNLEQAQTTIENLMQYNERLEKAVIETLAKRCEYGESMYMLDSEPESKLVSILCLHEYDWAKHKPQTTDEGYAE